MNLDPGFAIKLAQGEKKEIKEFARENGVPKQVIYAMIGIKNKDSALLYSSIKKIALNTPYQVSKEIIDCLIKLSMKHN